MSIQLDNKDLINSQQMEVAVNGPDGVTHLILCTGIAELDFVSHESYTFLVGPLLSRRQFVRAIASGALTRIQAFERKSAETNSDIQLEANLISINASYNDECGKVKVRVEVSSSIATTRLAISYNVSILAELPMY
jgi:protease II